MTILWPKHRLHLSLHSLVLSLLVDLLNLFAATRRRKSLMRQKIINLPLHSDFLFFSHHCSSVLWDEGTFGGCLTCALNSLLWLSSTRSKISWQLKPGKVCWPVIYFKLVFESHIGRQGHEVILIVRGVNTAVDTIGAHRDHLDRETVFKAVGKPKGTCVHLKKSDNVKNDNCPSIEIQIKRNLENEIILDINLLVEVGRRNSDSLWTIFQFKIDVEADRQVRVWSLHLEIEVASSEVQWALHTVGMRKLDVVVGRDIAKDAHDFPADLWSVTLLYIALPLIVFPVRSWQYFEIFENVHIGVLPDVLN